MFASPSVPILLALAIFGGGYWAGYSRADMAREAEVASLKEEYAEAYAKAEAEARERLEVETKRANGLAVKLQGAKKQIAAQTQSITRRIRNAAQAGAAGCSFGPDFVRLYNEALGYGGGALPQNAGAAGADHGSRPAPAPGPGLLPGRPVTPEDLLAHVRDYGAWSRGLEAQLRALGEFVREGR
ncbi:MAG: hypothetical protein HY795_04350 [Desulfovibrio sp.]|nr:hypothetical protein [Desulfovibrio sp.]MBI4960403.1 hypothetical protein [Desulfovibrio sp.]